MTNPTPPVVDPGRETRLVEVHGRQICIRKFTDAQGPLLARELDLARKDSTSGERKIQAVARIFDILESMVVQQEDRDFLLDVNVKGELALADLFGFLSAFSDDAPTTGPVVRRGRPRKHV
jgi:hypothetical protein